MTLGLAQFSSGNTDDFSSGRVNTLNSDVTSRDSINRPALRLIKKNLLNENSLEEIDTNHINPQFVEPFYRASFFSTNLGSENSASQTFPLEFYEYDGIELGYNQYRTLTNQFNPYTYIDPTRSYWSLHYGKGTTINSDNLEVNFYRKFAQGIRLNFDYGLYSDDSWMGNQANDFSRINLKLIQDNESQNRTTYFFFQNMSIDENHSRTLEDMEGSLSNWSNFHIELGNRMVLKDSLPQDRRLNMTNSLKILSNRYSFNDSELNDGEKVIYSPISDTLKMVSLENHLSSIEWHNTISLQNEGSTLGASLDYNQRTYRNALDTLGINEWVLGLLWEKRLSQASKLYSSLDFGLVDIAGELRAQVSYIRKSSKTPLNLTLRLKKYLPNLIWRRQVINNETLWTNEFVKSTIIQAEAQTKIYGIGVNIRANQLSNGVFLGGTGEPIQLNKALNHMSLTLSKEVNYKFIKSHHHIALNYVSDDILLAPSFQYAGDASIGKYLKKYNAQVDLGVNYYYIPSYTIPSFHPVFGIFYNDNTNLSSGDILIVNPYMRVSIDSFTFFLKSNNSLAALRSAVYPVKDYALYNYRVVFGIKWRLLD